MTSIAARWGNARFSADPFPHFVVEDALEPEAYEALTAAFPSLEAVAGDRPIANNRLYLRSTHEVVDDPAIDERWRAFFRHHVSTAFWQEILPLVHDAILSVHRDVEERAGRSLAEMSVAMREAPEAEASDIRLDCQFGLNSPVTAVSTVRTPHIDQSVKLFNALLYCRAPDDPTPDGDLELYRCTRPPAYGGGDGWAVLPSRIERALTVPYRANTLVLLINSPVSVHGVSPRPVTPHCRRYINFLCEYREPLFEIRRMPGWARRAELSLHGLGRLLQNGH